MCVWESNYVENSRILATFANLASKYGAPNELNQNLPRSRCDQCQPVKGYSEKNACAHADQLFDQLYTVHFLVDLFHTRQRPSLRLRLAMFDSCVHTRAPPEGLHCLIIPVAPGA